MAWCKNLPLNQWRFFSKNSVSINPTVWNHALNRRNLEFSKKLKLPAYVIFPDKTLIEMTKFKPKNIDDLEKIYGVGKAKSKKFSEYFLKVIQNH